jgi:hypothetical protein
VIILGFDPGGEIGLAVTRHSSTGSVSASVDSADSVDSAINWAMQQCDGQAPTAAGIDTLLCWGTGKSGWRPMDTYLRQSFPEVMVSVFASNSAYGAMAVQGMAIAMRLRQLWPAIHLNETHPKVLYHALTGKRYLRDDISPMTEWLRKQFSPPIDTLVKNEHQWDALISAWATWKGFSDHWKRDLTTGIPNLMFPAGTATYFWPDAVES